MTGLIEVRLPHMGTVERAVVSGWLKKVGDRVEMNDPLVEVATDKVDTEIPATREGVLVEILAQVDDEIEVGAVIARFAPIDSAPATVDQPGAASVAVLPEPRHERASSTAGGLLTEAAPVRSLVLAAATPAPVAAPAADDPRRLRGFPSSPLVRRLASEAGLDLAVVSGTGQGGKITRADIEKTLAALNRTEPSHNGRPTVQGTPAEPRRSPGEPAVPAGYEQVPFEAVRLSAHRRAIARNMVESVSTAPQLTAQVDVDMSSVARNRDRINTVRAGRGEPKLSYLPFIARGLCAILADHPDLNATFADDHLIRWRTVNLGVAVDAPHGLFVAVIHQAERLSLTGLAATMDELASRVRDRTADPRDLATGTITISNSGSVGGVTATPLLLLPQVASLGVPAIVRTPVAVTGADGEEYVAIRPIARLGLTFDHRAMDGAAALKALGDLKQRLESWPEDWTGGL